MTAFAWVFPALEVAPEVDDVRDVVVTVHWQYVATDEGLTVRECGLLTVTFDPESPFVPFDQLTQPVVEGWVTPRLDEAAMRRRLTNKLVAMAPPKSLIQKPPPWVA